METNEWLQIVVPVVVAVLAMIGLTVTPDEIMAIAGAVVSIVVTTAAIWERNRKKEAEVVASENGDMAVVAMQQTEALISPGMASPEVIAQLPVKAWKMSEETKKFLCSGAFKSVSGIILAQVAAHEANHEVHYFIDTGLNGIQYEIEYGLLKQQIGNT